MVAESDGKVVGFILLTHIKIENDQNSYDALALAPVAILPEYHGQGIGGQLIESAHHKAQEEGHTAIVLLGHEHYYPRFGYESAHTFEIKLPFDVPKENCMAIELVPGALDKVGGTVVYPKAFFE